MQILLLSWILAAKNGTTFAEWCEFYKKWLVKSWNQNYHDLKIQLQGWKHTSKFKPHVQPLRSGHGTLNCKWKQALLKVTSITGSYNALMIVFWCGHFFVSKKMDEFVTAICTCWKKWKHLYVFVCIKWHLADVSERFWKYLTLWWKWSFLMYMGVRIEVFTMCNASQKYLHGRTESGESTIRTFDAKNKINCDPTPMYKMFCSCSNLYIYIYVWNMTHICSQVKRFFVPKSAWRIILHLNCHQKPFQDQLIMTCASPYIFITY